MILSHLVYHTYDLQGPTGQSSNAVDIVHEDGTQRLYSCQHGCFTCMQSVVKSHLDAIPEDRKAIEKGGGNAVQKLHEVEKYIRKNKLKVSVQCQPTLLPAHHASQLLCYQGQRLQNPIIVEHKVCKAQGLPASN